MTASLASPGCSSSRSLKSLVSIPKSIRSYLEEEENKVVFENICMLLEDALDEKVEEVIVSDRLVSSSCCINRHLQASVEQIVKAQAL